jgi:ABC-type glutathione transport system ATPase component
MDLFHRRPASRVAAVKGVSLELRRGETVALVGESGSGKTTVARSLLRLVKAKGGTIEFAGHNIGALDARSLMALRRRIAMMFQDPVGSLSPRMRVGSIITEPLKIGRVKVDDWRVAADRLLDLVGLPTSFAARYPHELSGGQARRVGVARALALSPELVIADEPTAGLDVSVQGEVLNLLMELRERLRMSILIITHNLHVVRHISDRVAIMYQGEIVEEGSTEAIFERPGHAYTRKLLAANLHVALAG